MSRKKKTSPLPYYDEQRLSSDGLEPTEETASKLTQWHGGAKRWIGQADWSSRIKVVPERTKEAWGFEWQYERDDQGEIPRATPYQKARLNRVVATYLRRQLIRCNSELPPEVFQVAFRVGTNLPAERTVARVVSEAKKLPCDAETFLVIDVLLAMSLGEIPGPLAWRATQTTKWLFELIHTFELDRRVVKHPTLNLSDEEHNWLLRARGAFSLDYFEWLSTRHVRNARKRDDQRRTKQRNDSNQRPTIGQTLAEYLCKKKEVPCEEARPDPHRNDGTVPDW